MPDSPPGEGHSHAITRSSEEKMGLRHSYTKNLLFHYTTKEKAIEYIFRTMTIRLGSTATANDPRESDPLFFGFSIENEEVTPNHEELLDTQNRINKTLKKTCLIACFSEDKPDLNPHIDPERYHRS
ncbi:MAG TPA: hypothetical protein VEU50_02745, partial [Archangium sp.]|nr:hypothetical protein [Archangium sp.]